MPSKQPFTRFEHIRKPLHYFIYLALTFGLLVLSAFVMRSFT